MAVGCLQEITGWFCGSGVANELGGQVSPLGKLLCPSGTLLRQHWVLWG